jgi:hypothetical protein
MKNGLIIDKNGDKKWYLNDQLHREDGPVIEWNNGDKCYRQKGTFHREDGPAIEYVNGASCWYYNGKNVEKKFNIKITSVEQYQKLINLLVFE